MSLILNNQIITSCIRRTKSSSLCEGWSSYYYDQEPSLKWKAIHQVSVSLKQHEWSVFLKGIIDLASSTGDCRCLANILIDIQSLPPPREDSRSKGISFLYWTFLLHNKINNRLDKREIEWIECVNLYREELSMILRR